MVVAWKDGEGSKPRASPSDLFTMHQYDQWIVCFVYLSKFISQVCCLQLPFQFGWAIYRLPCSARSVLSHNRHFAKDF